MKKLIILILVFISLKGMAQYPVPQSIGGDSTLVSARGGFKGRVVNYYFTDTTQANLQRIKQYPYAQIVARNTLWIRDSTATRWLLSSSNNGRAIDSISIVNDNTIRICNGQGVCTNLTIAPTITSLTNVYFSTDSSIVVCNGSNVCETIIIPHQQIDIYQNGLSTPFPGIHEFGGSSPLVHHTVLNQNGHSLTFQQTNVTGPIYIANNTNPASVIMSQPGSIGLTISSNGDLTSSNTPISLKGYGIGNITNLRSHFYGGLEINPNRDSLTGFWGRSIDADTALKINPVKGYTTIGARFQEKAGVDVVAANNLTLSNGNLFTITGLTQINAITTLGWQAGSFVKFIFTGAPTVKHNTAGAAGTATLILAGATDFLAAANDVLTLVYNGTSWYETARKLAAGSGIVGITANNGLSASTPTNVQLGGSPLLFNTSITTSAFSLTVPSSNVTSSLIVSNSSVGGTGIKSTAQSGNAFQGEGSGTVAQFRTTSGLTTGSQSVLNLIHNSTDVPTTNFGLEMNFALATATIQERPSHKLVSKWTDAIDASRTSQFEIWGTNNTSFERLFTLSGNGRTTLNKYGVGSFTAGTPVYTLVTDASGNIMEYPSGGGLPVTAITADNGLTANTATNVRLGGTLLQNTTINATSSYYLDLTGARTTGGSNYVLHVSHTNNGIGIYGESNSTGIYGVSNGGGNGVIGSSPTGNGVNGSTNSYIGVYGSAVTGKAFVGDVQPSSTNTVVPVYQSNRGTSGTAANGIGGSFDFYTQSDGSTSLSNQLISKWTDATNATRTSQFIITGVNNAVTADLFTLSGSGSTKLNKYGVGTFTGTPATYAAWDASGNMIELSSIGTAPVVTADNGLTKNTATNVQLGGTLLANTSIDATVNYALTITGSVPDVTKPGVLLVNQTAASGTAITATASSTNSAAIQGNGGAIGISGSGTSTGGYGSSTNGNGFWGVSTNSAGILGQSTNREGINSITNPSSTNTTVTMAVLERTTSGTAANNIGGGIDLKLETTTGASQISASIVTTWTDATNATRTGDLQFFTTNSATSALKMRIKGSGIINITTNTTTYADNAAAVAGGLVQGDLYWTATGQLMRVL